MNKTCTVLFRFLDAKNCYSLQDWSFFLNQLSNQAAFLPFTDFHTYKYHQAPGPQNQAIIWLASLVFLPHIPFVKVRQSWKVTLLKFYGPGARSKFYGPRTKLVFMVLGFGLGFYGLGRPAWS